TYTLTYTPTKSGDDEIAITLGGVAISGSAFTSAVVPGAVSGSHTTAVVPDGVAGEATEITVTARDAQGNPVGAGGSTVAATVSGANAGLTVAVADNGDGTYTLTYTPTKSGVYEKAMTLGGVARIGCARASSGAPGAVSGSHTTAVVPDGVAGEATE